MLQSITADPTAVTAAHVLIAAIRAALPPAARPRRDEILAALSQAGYRLQFSNRRLFVAGCKLA